MHYPMVLLSTMGRHHLVAFRLTKFAMTKKENDWGDGACREASKFNIFSCNSISVTTISWSFIAWTSFLYLSSRPSRIFLARSFLSIDASRIASSLARDLTKANFFLNNQESISKKKKKKKMKRKENKKNQKMIRKSRIKRWSKAIYKKILVGLN